MKLTRKMKVLISILLVPCVLWAGFLVYRNSIITNVFDEMYYSMRGSLWVRGPWSINHVFPFDRWMAPTYVPGDIRDFRYYSLHPINEVSYSLTQTGERIKCSINLDENELRVCYYLDDFDMDGPPYMKFYCTYSPDNKTLVLNPIENVHFEEQYRGSGDRMELAHTYLDENGVSQSWIEDSYFYFLYDTVLNNYFIQNEKTSRFSMEQPGRYTIVDERDPIPDEVIQPEVEPRDP